MDELPIIGLTLNYRDASRTAKCVRSLQADGIAHVFVWDNSADGGASAGVLSAALADNSGTQIVVSDANLGFAAGVNRGLAAIAEAFPSSPALLINNDALLMTGALPILRSALIENQQAHVVYPDVDHGGWVRGSVYYQRLTGMISDHRVPGSFAFPSGCCLLVNLPLSGAAIFDQDFFMYGEDIALGARLGRDPTTMHHVPQKLVLHEGSASSGMATPFYESHMTAAHLLLARKLANGNADYGLLLLGRVAFLPTRALVRALRYRSLAPVRALREGWGIARNSCSGRG